MHTINKDGSVTFTNDDTRCTVTLGAGELTNNRYRLIKIQATPNAPAYVAGYVGGLLDLLTEARDFKFPEYRFDTYEWVDGRRACIRRISDNAMVAAHWPHDLTSDAEWRTAMHACHADIYPGITL